MDVFGWLKILEGLSLFLYGMYLLAEGLTRTAGGRLERLLGRMSDSAGKAVLAGAGITALVQSSSAVTVMVVGLVDSGVLGLRQAVGIIMGANVGTTVTAWILGAACPDSVSAFAGLLKPAVFAPILGMAGVLILLFSAQEKQKNRACLLVGFAILLFGMDTMGGAVAPLADAPEFAGALLRFSDPIWGVVAGIVSTGVLQSSSASIGMLQALCAAGTVNYRTAIPIILGQNIGTCVTAMLSGIGTGRNARCAALVHLSFNVIGAGLFLAVFFAVSRLFDPPVLAEPADGLGIAFLHSLFNIGTALVLFPFSKGLEKLASLAVKKGEDAVTDPYPPVRQGVPF